MFQIYPHIVGKALLVFDRRINTELRSENGYFIALLSFYSHSTPRDGASSTIKSRRRERSRGRSSKQMCIRQYTVRIKAVLLRVLNH